MSFWRKPPSPPVETSYNADRELLKTLLDLEKLRLERTAELDAKRAELDLRKAELELADLERIGTEKRKQALFAEGLKEQRREAAARAREAKQAKARAASQGQTQMFGCEECKALREGRTPAHSADLIRHANEHHQVFNN